MDFLGTLSFKENNLPCSFKNFSKFFFQLQSISLHCIYLELFNNY